MEIGIFIIVFNLYVDQVLNQHDRYVVLESFDRAVQEEPGWYQGGAISKTVSVSGFSNSTTTTT